MALTANINKMNDPLYADTMTWVRTNLRCTMQLHVDFTLSPVPVIKRWQINIAGEAAVWGVSAATAVNNVANTC
jgi:hypothetical protein